MNPKFHPPPPLSYRSGWSIGPALLLLLNLLVFVMPARALVIIPVWDSSITNDPNAATIESTINMAIQFFEARFADPITVSIEFQEKTSGLGENSYYYYNIPYTQFFTSLQNDATTTNDTYALAHLPAGPADPVTGNGLIHVKTANLKAIGLTGYVSQLPGGFDGIIKLNTSTMNLSRASNNPSKYDLLCVAEHEMDEVLGLGSDLDFSSPDYTFPEDLFRYTAAGARTFTKSGDNAYFSLDGTNLLVRCNQASSGNYGDWWSTGAHTPRVQDAFGTPGATPNMGVELLALDVQGYDLIPPPQPGIVQITLSGTNLVVTGTNGLATGAYHLLASTNAALALSRWSPVATNFLTANGNFTFTATNAVNPQSTQQFYVLQLQ